MRAKFSSLLFVLSNWTCAKRRTVHFKLPLSSFLSPRSCTYSYSFLFFAGKSVYFLVCKMSSHFILCVFHSFKWHIQSSLSQSKGRRITGRGIHSQPFCLVRKRKRSFCFSFDLVLSGAAANSLSLQSHLAFVLIDFDLLTQLKWIYFAFTFRFSHTSSLLQVVHRVYSLSSSWRNGCSLQDAGCKGALFNRQSSLPGDCSPFEKGELGFVSVSFSLGVNWILGLSLSFLFSPSTHTHSGTSLRPDKVPPSPEEEGKKHHKKVTSTR